MEQYFYQLMDYLTAQLHGAEIFLCKFEGEHSDFTRFNHAKIRQAGTVEQRYLTLDLIDGARHAHAKLALSGEKTLDQAQLLSALEHLRAILPSLPADPHLLYATEINSSEHLGNNALPHPKYAVTEIINQVQGHDFVGIYAEGGIFKGFANSLGQRNWHSSYSFNLDWSFYHSKDKAVKTAYAGLHWDNAAFQQKVDRALQELELLKQPSRKIPRGKYRVYLAPAALSEIIGMLTWDGFSAKAHCSKQSPLLRMSQAPKQNLHPSISLCEHTAGGIAPAFQAQGFIKPDAVTLIEKGEWKTALISPRSAQEFGLVTNGADEEEMPNSLQLAAGDFPQADVLKTLDTGVYINNLWYLNYSDRAACRITGMTRFASFWVEKGEIVAPLDVMRFDETIFNVLGDNLLALTQEQEMIIDSDTYEQRSVNSALMSGALVKDFTFTL